MMMRVAAAVLLMGCATTGHPCPTASEAMRPEGLVLECYQRRYADTGDVVDRCLIMTRQHTYTEKTVYVPHCGL